MWWKPGGTHPGSDWETENQTDGWAQGYALRRGKKWVLGAQVWEGMGSGMGNGMGRPVAKKEYAPDRSFPLP